MKEATTVNTDKAYLLGLSIGGGIWGNSEDVFRIRLPFKQWGSYLDNPQRAGQISRDILQVVSPMFKATYGLNISYEGSTNVWYIMCEGDMTEFRSDLNSYGIACEGELRQNSDLSGVIPHLVDDNLKRRFIAGLSDTIGSTAKSHRRFTDEIQILSFEVNGFNYSFICQLCRLMYSVNCIPDQILWNHPNFHCTNNPYYKQWTKGFKLRIQLDQYARFGAFAFRTKAESSQSNRGLQKQTHTTPPCPDREISVSPSCQHPAESDMRLPENIRGGHYLHNRHVCAVMGCEHAPYDKISELFTRSGELITPFPILCKDSLTNIEQIIANESLLSNRTYDVANHSVEWLYTHYQADNKAILFGDGNQSGYLIAKIMQAIAYIIADDSELAGKRTKGSFLALIKRHLSSSPVLTVELRRPDLLTPLVICGNGRGALIGANNPEVYSNLVSISPDNQYKLCVRQITEEDLSDA